MDCDTRRVLPVPLVGIVLGLLLAAGAAVFMAATSAHAEVSAPCTASIAGADVGPLSSTSTGDAIDVDHSDDVVATMGAQQGFASHKIKLRFMGNIIPARTVESRTDNGETSFTETVKVSDYAWMGVGLYKVSGEATLADGTRCTGAALVNVTGRNPLTTVVGGVATGAVVLGTAGAVASGVSAATGNARPMAPAEEFVNMMEEASSEEERRRRLADQEREWMTRPEAPNAAFLAWVLNIPLWWGCLCLAVLSLLLAPLVALTGGAPGGGSPAAPVSAPAAGAPRNFPRAPWMPRITLVGIVGGVLAGVGILALLQQFAVVYPTMSWLIGLVVVGIVGYGLVVPTLGYTIGWLRLNGKVARIESEMK